MSLPAVYLPEAVDDIVTAYAQYERQLPGLGGRFVEALGKPIFRIRDNPQTYAVFRHGARAAPMRRFSYVVYYRDRASDVLIVAVQHGRRSSRGWRGQV